MCLIVVTYFHSEDLYSISLLKSFKKKKFIKKNEGESGKTTKNKLRTFRIWEVRKQKNKSYHYLDLF